MIIQTEMIRSLDSLPIKRLPWPPTAVWKSWLGTVMIRGLLVSGLVINRRNQA
jgi:hypothetical protein